MADKDTPGGGPREIVRADEKPIHLDEAQQELLQKLLDAGQKLQEDVEEAIRAFGRYVLTEALHSKSSAAIEVESSKDPVIRELLRRAGGPTLKPNAFIVSTAIRIAGWERRLQHEAFTGLDYYRKVHLLPLNDGDKIKEATDHIVKFKLSEEATEDYVKNLRKESGKPVVTRLSPRRARGHIRSLKKRLTDNRALPRLVDAIEELSEGERAELEKDVEDLMDVLARVKAATKKKR